MIRRAVALSPAPWFVSSSFPAISLVSTCVCSQDSPLQYCNNGSSMGKLRDVYILRTWYSNGDITAPLPHAEVHLPAKAWHLHLHIRGLGPLGGRSKPNVDCLLFLHRAFKPTKLYRYLHGWWVWRHKGLSCWPVIDTGQANHRMRNVADITTNVARQHAAYRPSLKVQRTRRNLQLFTPLTCLRPLREASHAHFVIIANPSGITKAYSRWKTRNQLPATTGTVTFKLRCGYTQCKTRWPTGKVYMACLLVFYQRVVASLISSVGTSRDEQSAPNRAQIHGDIRSGCHCQTLITWSRSHRPLLCSLLDLRNGPGFRGSLSLFALAGCRLRI